MLYLLIFPLPDLFNELLSAEVMSGHPSLPHQFLLHHHLSRNASMIAARVPQCGLASHPVPASSDQRGPVGHRTDSCYWFKLILQQHLLAASYCIHRPHTASRGQNSVSDIINTTSSVCVTSYFLFILLSHLSIITVVLMYTFTFCVSKLRKP